MPNLMLDVFTEDAFNMINMTTALQKLPYQTSRLGQLNLFNFTEGVETNTIMIDELNGELQLLSNRPRGSEPERAKKEVKAKSRAVGIPHMQFEDRILAASLFGKRQPGESELQNVVRKVNDSQARMRQAIETTWEVHRLNALKGVLLDADGSVITDFFDLFEVVQQTHNFAFSVATTNVRNQVVAALRKMEAELGGIGYAQARAICGATFFDNLISHASVKEAYQLQQSQLLGQDLRYAGFTWGGVVWEEYRGMTIPGADANVGLVAAAEAVLFPTGVPSMYRVYFAPGDFMETVNTVGIPMYSKAAPDLQYNRWVDLLAETNPLHINTRPRAVLKLTQS